jgi:hypothetical protein
MPSEHKFIHALYNIIYWSLLSNWDDFFLNSRVGKICFLGNLKRELLKALLEIKFDSENHN